MGLQYIILDIKIALCGGRSALNALQYYYSAHQEHAMSAQSSAVLSHCSDSADHRRKQAHP